MDHFNSDDATQNSFQIKQHNIRRKVKNRIVTGIIVLSGWLVLLTLGLLLWHLLVQVFPLFGTPTFEQGKQLLLPSNQQVLQLNNVLQGRAIVSIDEKCDLHFLQARSDITSSEMPLISIKTLPGQCDDDMLLKQFRGENFIARLSASGIVRIARYSQVQDTIQHQVVTTLAISDELSKDNITSWHFEVSNKMFMLSVQRSDVWQIFSVNRQDPSDIQTFSLSDVSQLVLLPEIGQIVYRKDQQLYSQNLRNAQVTSLGISDPIDFIQAFPNQRSVMFGFADGRVEKWGIVNDAGNLIFKLNYRLSEPFKLQKLHVHRDENAAILVGTNKSLLVINYVTGETITEQELTEQYLNTYWRGNLFYGQTQSALEVWRVDGMSAVNTISAMWDKIQYEGYAASEYIWQTTYATDFQETKYSIVPLLIGSLKASFLALLIAIPLATFSAVYTGFFAPARLRNWMKPSIEMLEALPSVIIGFIAAVWLAPLAEQFLLSLILFILLIPLVLLIFAFVHQPLVKVLPQHFKEGWELPVIACLLILNGVLVAEFTQWYQVGQTLTHEGNLFSSSALVNLNKSTLVVALALGIAITPSIYSLAEDAIYEVPLSLKQASLALGATRLQTLRKVVLTLAYPGILSAIVLGLGRAFGETMIVLMVTGNTPVADWDLLAGFRTLTANLTIELPEAEVGSGHYQILFFTALILFMFTFVINTLAEMLRQWLRRNYRHA